MCIKGGMGIGFGRSNRAGGKGSLLVFGGEGGIPCNKTAFSIFFCRSLNLKRMNFKAPIAVRLRPRASIMIILFKYVYIHCLG